MTPLSILVISYRSILISSFDETFSLIDLRITIFSTLDCCERPSMQLYSRKEQFEFDIEVCIYIYIIRYNYTILTSVSTSHIGEVGSGKEGRKGMRFSRDPPHEDY